MIRLTRYDYEKEMGVSWFQMIKFELFGELKIFFWLFLVAALVRLAIAATVLYVLVHFIVKHW